MLAFASVACRFGYDAEGMEGSDLGDGLTTGEAAAGGSLNLSDGTGGSAGANDTAVDTVSAAASTGGSAGTTTDGGVGAGGSMGGSTSANSTGSGGASTSSDSTGNGGSSTSTDSSAGALGSTSTGAGAAGSGGTASTDGTAGTGGVGSTGGAAGSSSTTASVGGSTGSGGATSTTSVGGSTGSGSTTTNTTSTTGGPAVGEDPYCERIHRLASAPVIDGVLDAGLPLQDLAKTFVRIPADNPPEFSTLPSDVSLRFAVAWFDTGLYFFGEVTDPDRYPALVSMDEWLGDGFEVYVDHDGVFAAPGVFDNPGTRTLTVAAPANDTDPSTRGGIFRPGTRQGPWRGDFIAVPKGYGYDVELVVVAADLGLKTWNLQPGDSLGFDLSHGVSFPAGEVGSEGRRLGHYFLQIAPNPTGVNADYPFNNSNVYCVPVLEDTP